jgi:hypothetical protein
MSACIGWGIFGFLVGAVAMFFFMVGMLRVAVPDDTEEEDGGYF